MDNMEHAIEQAARVLDKAMDSAEWRWAEDPDDAPTLLARTLADAGLLAPAPLHVELRDSGDLGLTPGAFTQSRWATAWDDGYNAGKNDLRDNRVFRTRNPHRGAGQ